tara:strand:+ start:7008 stop:7463 length:456 start_codon:yes stop_codon:yes gene_type:complete
MEKIMAYIAGALIGVLWFSLVLAAEPAAEDETTAETDRSLTEEMESIDQAVTADAWNIRNGCVPLRRVRRIEFVDDQTAIITLFGKKKVVLRLQRVCPGIKRNGFLHENRGHRLCEGFDRFTVLGGSMTSCRVESLEPYITIEAAEPEGKP